MARLSRQKRSRSFVSRTLERLEPRLAMAVYLNEVHVSPLFGSTDQDQYIEIRSDRETALANGTYLVVLEGSSGASKSAGRVHTIFDLSNQAFGSNGFLVLAEQGNRYTFDANARVLKGSTVGFTGMPGNIFSTEVSISNHIDFIVGSNTYLLIQSSVAPKIGDDIDAQDDGTPDGVWSNWNVLDGVAAMYWIDSGSGIFAYAPIVFRERGVGSSPIAQTIIDCEQISYMARIGDSTGSTAGDWLSGNTVEDVNGGVADFRLANGTFGTPRPYAFSGRGLDHIGSSNFAGRVNGVVFKDDNLDGIKQASETQYVGVNVLADSNANGVQDGLIYRLEPDSFPTGSELTNAGTGATLTVGRADNTQIGFAVRSKDRFPAAPTNPRLLASEGIPWFSSSGRLRIDFYRPAQAVAITFTGTSSTTYGRLEAYDANGQSLGFVRTNPLAASQSERLSLSYGDGRIAYAVAYCEDTHLSSSPFGELDDLQYVIPEAVSVTKGDGSYSLPNLAPGTYRVRAQTPSGMILNSPVSGFHTLNVLVSQGLSRADFGYRSNQAPLFQNQSFGLPENVPNLQIVGGLTASDPDPGQSLQFKIESGDPDGVFSIDGENLIVQKTELVNFETKKSYVLGIRATDSFSQPASTVASVTINVQDLNDPPVVAAGAASINENSLAGTFVVKATASDEDTGAAQDFLFQIVGGNTNNAFAIDPSTGDITVVGGLNFESQTIYALIVEATDRGSPPQSGRGTISISLRDINEAPTIDTNTFTVDENVLAGSLVGFINAKDPDQQQTLEFSIVGGTAANLLSLIGTTNQLVVAPGASFDFEKANQWTLVVSATDSGNPPLSVTKTLTINVADKNDPPKILTASLSTQENSPSANAIGTVQASDEDPGQTLSYSIVGGADASKFRIDSATGQVYPLATTLLDFETTPTFTIEVSVVDSGNPSAKSSSLLSILLTDQNDPPSLGTLSFSLNENSQSGTLVTTVSANDQDAGENLNYSMDANDYLTIGATTGRVEVKPGAILNFEILSSIKVPVSVRDKANATAQSTLTLSINDVNDAPSAIGSIPIQKIRSDKPWSFPLPTGLFADEDAGDSLKYSAFSGSGFSLPTWLSFSTTTNTFTGQPPISERGVHSIQLVAKDKGNLASQLNFEIEVLGNIWHNYGATQDVDGKGFVSPLDALLVLNYLNLGKPATGPSLDEIPTYQFDVNNDLLVTPLDSLLVLNFLNLKGSGEGESLAVATATHATAAENRFDFIEPIESTYDLLANDRLRRRARS